MIRHALFGLIVSVGIVPLGLAQAPAKPDTVTLIRIGDSWRVLTDTTTIFFPGAIVVGSRAAKKRSANTLQRIPLAEISRSDAASVADVTRLIPGAHAQTNSRGETLLYLRNSGERQLAVFFDGAMINIPWDNRVDLDLIPTSALASISVSKGATSSEFGPNLIGGAVNLITRDLAHSGHYSEATVQLGSGEERRIDATHLGRVEGFSYLAAVGFVDRDGVTLPNGADLPYSQTDPDLRTNTDLRRFNALARGEYVFDSEVVVSVAAMMIDAEKGIAPESHLNPEDGGVRYWRYPDWENGMLIATVGRPAGEGRTLSYQTSFWVNQFHQRILAYSSDAFDQPVDEQKDDDSTIGSRVVVSGDYDHLGVRVAAGAIFSNHDQVETTLAPPGSNESDDVGPKQEYGQVLLNGGVEVDYRSGRAVYSAGLNVDSRSVTEADVFEEPDGQLQVGFRTGLIYEATSTIALKASIGKRARFPTLREQFSGALGRFILNPDLSSEEAILGETSIRYAKERASIEAIGFATFTSNTIDQTVLIVDGESKRQRVNLDGSRNFGVELVASYRPLTYLSIALSAMTSRLRAEDGETGSYDRPLTERPETTGSIRGVYVHPAGFTGSVEALYSGAAYSLDDDGEFVDLGSSTLLNLRAAYRLPFRASSSMSVEIFGRANNVGDVVVHNQLGLPGPGRTLIAGAKISV